MKGVKPPRFVERPVDRPLAGVHPVLGRIYGARGVTSKDQLNHELKALLSPEGLPDIDRAVDRLARAIREGQRILLVGDFDADGATSVALGVSVLRALGAEQVDFVVPNRFTYGYGLSPEIVDLAATHSPDLLVTVDNGVASIAGVEQARTLGIDVIITDHHLPGKTLPPALAVVNPVLDSSTFGSRNLAGVGVIFYVLSRLRSRLAAEGWFESKGIRNPNMAECLDLVALGTVADVVPLDHNNRVLVAQGIARIRAGRARPGIAALLQVARRDAAKINASDLGFAVGPRLNAAGRLDDMTIGIRCLLASTLEEARSLAIALDQLNRARQELEQVMVADAEMIVSQQVAAGEGRDGICLYDPGWHQGVVGIVAGRLKDRLHRPVIAFAEAGSSAPDELKGSARSVPGLHMRDLLDAIATSHPGLLPRFGGHAMAAGLSLKRIHFKQFATVFNKLVSLNLPAESRDAIVYTDGALALDDLSLETADALASAGPWGQAFPEPLFQGEFEVISHRIVGENHLKLTVSMTGAERRRRRLIDAIAFRQAELATEPFARAYMTYRVSRNDYGDVPTVQLVVEHLVPVA